MKKIIVGSIAFLILGFGLVVLLFYWLSVPKSRDVSNEKPFSDIVNKTLTTKTDLLILNDESIKKDEHYKYHLEDGNSYGMDSGLEVVAELPIGTAVTIDKVELYTNKVSGGTIPYLFGSVHNQDLQTQYTFQYTWGDHHVLYEDKPYWTFPLAFWQDEPLTKTYTIEVP